MFFWIFMTVSNFLIPVIMIIFGRIFIKKPPKTINGIYGYRTSMSRKNQETWDFAHKYCGKLWWRVGWMLMPLSIIGMFPVIGKDDNMIGIMGLIIETVEVVLMIGTIFLTEIALKNNFDKEGRRRAYSCCERHSRK